MKAKFLIMLAGIAMLAACKGKVEEATTDSVAAFVEDSAKIVKTADMRFKVRNVQNVSSQLSNLVAECGGSVVHNKVHSEVIEKRDITLESDSIKKLTVYNTNADVVVKVPTEFLDVFMDSLKRLSVYVDESNMNVEDRTLDYLSQQLKAANRDESVKLRRKVKLTHAGADSMLMLKDDAVDRRIGNFKTNDAVKYSTLSLNLYQGNTVHSEVVANDDLSTYHTPLNVQVGKAFSTGWNIFVGFMVGILHLWLFILVGIAVLIAVRAYRKSKKAVGPVA